MGDAVKVGGEALAIGGTIASLAFPPLGAVLVVAGGLTSAGGIFWDRMKRKAGVLAEGVAEQMPAAEFVEAVETREDAAALAVQAVDATKFATADEQARVLGRVIADALRATGDLTTEEGALVVEAIRSLDLIHFRALQAMTGPVTDVGAGIGRSLGIEDPATGAAVAAALERAGAIRLWIPPMSGGLRSGSQYEGSTRPKYLVTPFGERLRSYLRPED